MRNPFSFLHLLILITIYSFSVFAQTSAQGVTANDLLNDPTVRNEIEDAWNDSGVGTSNPHEEGGWVYRSVDANGNVTYQVDRWPPGPTCSLAKGCGINPAPQNPPAGYDTVGHFHTHPMPEFDSSGNPTGWDPKPSNNDEAYAKQEGQIGIVRNENGTDSYNGFGCTQSNPCNDNSGDKPPPPKTSAPPCTSNCGGASTHGDPHLISVDGLGAGFQAVGEFVLIESSAGDFAVQVRQQPRQNSRTVSVNDAIAINIMGDRFAIYPVRDADPFRYDTYINGILTPLEQPVTTLPNGGRIFIRGNDLLLVWPDTSQIVLHPNTSSAAIPRINAEIQIVPERQGTFQGLWGNFDGDSSNDVTVRNGATLQTSPTFEQFYREWGESWRVSDETSLFDYLEGENTETYTDRDFPDEPVTRSRLPADDRERAEQTCRNAGLTEGFLFDACVIDVVLMNDDSFANDAATVSTSPDFEPPDEIVKVEEPITFGGWSEQGEEPDRNDVGEWTISDEGNSVFQTTNGRPTYFVSPNSYQTVTIQGAFEVEGDSSDLEGDFIGFVIGYTSPLASSNDTLNDLDFLLFDWKSEAQTISGLTAPAGFALSRVQGTLDVGNGNAVPGFWDHQNFEGFEVLATDFGDDRGWIEGEVYNFELRYSPTQIQIFIDGTLIFDETGTFPEGRFGFYNYSQANVRYADFSAIE